MKKEDMKIAVVCSSNQNRSMEAHAFLKKKDFDVHSFGSGSQVKLPGASMHQPNIYDFNTTYEEMYRDLASKDHQLYTGNGILRMLDRNRRIKPKPERFQDSPLLFDMIVTCEERVYDQVLEEFENRTVRLYKPVYVVNIDILDNHEAATLGAITINDFCQKVKDSADLDGYIEEVIIRMDNSDWTNLLYAVVFY